jgi:hypothetical protein
MSFHEGERSIKSANGKATVSKSMTDFVSDNPLVADFDPTGAFISPLLKKSAASGSNFKKNPLHNVCLERSSVSSSVEFFRVHHNDSSESFVAQM